MSGPATHAMSNVHSEYTLCGVAFDAHESGDVDEPVIMAKAGELVTCAECRTAIDHAKSAFKRYRYKG